MPSSFSPREEEDDDVVAWTDNLPKPQPIRGRWHAPRYEPNSAARVPCALKAETVRFTEDFTIRRRLAREPAGRTWSGRPEAVRYAVVMR